MNRVEMRKVINLKQEVRAICSDFRITCEDKLEKIYNVLDVDDKNLIDIEVQIRDICFELDSQCETKLNKIYNVVRED